MTKFAAGLLALFLFAGCKSQPHTVVPAPDFALKDMSGKPVQLSSFRGRPVLLDFWATWCGPCQASIPWVQRFYEEHKDEGLVVLGLNMDDDPALVYPFVSRYSLSYPVLYAGGSSAPDDFHVDGIPSFVFVDAEGRIAEEYHGFRMDMVEEWERAFERLKPSKAS